MLVSEELAKALSHHASGLKQGLQRGAATAKAAAMDDDALLAELNRALGMMKSSGTLRYILNRWIPVTVEVR